MTAAPRLGWCVVGGGMLGLTVARRLSQAGQDVTLIEASPRLGGLADAWTIGDVTWDRHYHVTLTSDHYMRGLLDEIGLGESLMWRTTKSDFYTGGQFHPLNNSVDFLRFPPLNLIDKFRLGATIMYASRLKDGRSLESVSLEDWLVKLSGRSTFEKIWRPLVRAKLGDNYKRASASYIWSVINRFYGAREKGAAKTEMFGYADGGYNSIVERFAAVLGADGVRIETGRPVSRIAREAGRLKVATDAAERSFDRVVFTGASALATRVCEGLTAAETKALSSTLYQGIVCASVLLKKPLRNSYITYIADQSIPYTAVIEMTAIVDKAQFGGRSLVYLPAYVPSDDPLFEVSDADVEARFLAAFLRMYPSILPEDIEAFRVSRVRHVLAISTLNFTANLPPIAMSVPGLYVLNSAHIVNASLNVNDTVKLADERMPELLSSLSDVSRSLAGAA
jgi:protoporphyrinogen oxidase